MYQPLLNLHTWVSLPNEVRYKIRTLFNIPCSGNVVVNDGRIETDGTSTEDFKALTIEKMQEYLKTDLADFNKLFDMVVVKIKEPVVISQASTALAVETTVSVPKKRGRPSLK